MDKPPFDLARFEAIVREAGALALRDFRDGAAALTKSWAKQGGSPVSEADLAVDRLLRDRLGDLLPDAGWLSEETADSADRLGRRYIWIVDPIDGTRAFLKGKPGWCISVALVEQGHPVVAALHAPTPDIYYQARAGAGAFANGKRLQVSACNALIGARKPTYNLSDWEKELVAVDCPNSIALRIAMIASGAADCINTLRWGGEWDIAAAHLIATEADAVVTDVNGDPIRFNQPKPRIFGVMAAAPGLYDALRQKVASHLPATSAKTEGGHSAQ